MKSSWSKDRWTHKWIYKPMNQWPRVHSINHCFEGSTDESINPNKEWGLTDERIWVYRSING